MKLYRAKTPARAIEITSGLVAAAGEKLGRKNYVFCESRASLSYELGLCDKTGGSFSTSVMSFSRYVALNSDVDKYLGKTAATLVVRKIMEECSDRLVRFKRCSPNLAVNVYNIISQLKSAKVGVEDLENVLIKEGGAFASKLKDIILVYEKYEEFIKENGYTDENSYLSLMPEILRKDESVKGATVIVSGIGNMTGKTIDIILTLDAVADLSVVTVSGDGAGYTNEIYYKMLELDRNCSVFDDTPSDSVHEAIINGLFDPTTFKKVGLYSDKVHIFEYPDVRAEAEAVAKRIKFEVIENGRRYKDIVVATNNVTLYAPLYERVFRSYGIPVFTDRKKKLSSCPVFSLFCDLIDVKRLNFKPERCLSVVKNPYFTTPENASAFENYLINVTPSRRMMVNPFGEEIAESVRKQLFDLCSDIPLKDSVNGYIDRFLGVFDTLGIREKSLEMVKALSGYGEQTLSRFDEIAVQRFIEILGETKGVIGETVVTLDSFKSLVSSAVCATEISLIATGNDNVFFGDTKTAPLRNAEILFAVGFDSSVPDVKQDTSLLSDRDLVRLDGYKCVIEPKLKVVNVRARENVMTTLASFKEKLFVSYSRLGFAGEKIVKGEVTEYLEKIFGVVARCPSDEKAAGMTRFDDVYDYLSENGALSSALKSFEAFRTNKTDSTDTASAFVAYLKENDKPAYKFIIDYFSDKSTSEGGDLKYNGKLSASLIETYFSCPFKAFGERVLGLKRLSTGETAANEIGNIFHKVLQKFAPLCVETDRNDVPAVALKIAGEVLSEPDYSRYLNKKQFEYIFSLVKDEIVSVCEKVYDDLESSDFKVFGTEVVFSDVPGSAFRAINVDTVGGTKKVNGIIDRIDRYKDYLRIVDYKTGSAIKDKVSPESLYAGVSIQLYLYMNAVEGAYRLAGGHYLEISDGYKSEGSDNKNYYGQTLADDEVIAHLDTTAEGESARYAIKRKKDMSFSAASQVLTDEELKAYTRYAKLITKSGADDIYGGFFIPSPYTEKACEYCKLKGACGYDCDTGNATRELNSVSKGDVMRAVDEGVTGDE